jgi:hypothetical protein
MDSVKVEAFRSTRIIVMDKLLESPATGRRLRITTFVLTPERYVNEDLTSLTAQLKPIIYTSSDLWQQVTGGTPENTSIGQCFNGGMCIKLWDANYDGGTSRHGVPSLFFGYRPPKAWTGYAGWNPSDSPPNPRFGKQYSADCKIGTLSCTDQLSIGEVADEVSTAKAVCGNPEGLVDLDVFDPGIFQ